jgi:rod shape-determining protein MreD
MYSFFSIENLDWVWRTLLAQSVIIALFIISLVNFSIPLAGEIRPHLVFLAVYFWTIYRPSFLSPVWVFALGIGLDLLLNYPLGINAILLLSLSLIIRRQRVFLMGQTYFVVWMIFGLSAFVAMGIEWLVFCLIKLSIFSFYPVFMTWLLTLCLYPLMNALFLPVYHLLPAPPKTLS